MVLNCSRGERVRRWQFYSFNGLPVSTFSQVKTVNRVKTVNKAKTVITGNLNKNGYNGYNTVKNGQ